MPNSDVARSFCLRVTSITSPLPLAKQFPAKLLWINMGFALGDFCGSDWRVRSLFSSRQDMRKPGKLHQIFIMTVRAYDNN